MNVDADETPSADSQNQPTTHDENGRKPDRSFARPWLDPASVGRFLVVLLALGASSTTFAFLLVDGSSEFFKTNQLALKTRLLVLAVGWLFALSASMALLLRGRKTPSGARTLERFSKLLAPLLVLPFVPALFNRQAFEKKELALLSYALALGLAVERLLRPALGEVAALLPRKLLPESKARWLRWTTLALIVLVAGAYAFRTGALANASHLKLATSSSDLAEYDNMFWNALHGHPFRSPAIAGYLEDWNTLQGHAEFGLYFLLPFYAISPGAHALLWIQAFLVGLTAIPIFLLGRHRHGNFVGFAFALGFLMTPSVQRPSFYDFHFTPLGMFFVAWILYFAARLASIPESRPLRTALYVMTGAAFLCREDMSIGIAVLGLFLVLSGKLVRDGAILVVVSSVYFVGMKFGIMPLFGRWWFDNMYDEIKSPGAHGFGSVILSMISNPSFVLRSMLIEPKLLYVLHMTAPVLALWLRRPLLWLAFLPGFVATLLVTNRPPMYQASFQYTYFWLPYVFAASIIALRRGREAVAAASGILLVTLALSIHLGVFPSGEKILGGFSEKTFDVTEADRKRYSQLQEIIAKIPPDATVTVTESEGPHLSTRLVMYSLKYTLGPSPDYILISQPRVRGEAERLKEALASGKYGVINKSGPFTLLKRGADPSKNEQVWRKVGGRPAARPPKQESTPGEAH